MTIQSRATSDLLTEHVIVRRVIHGVLAASALAALSVSAPALAQQAPAAPAPADQELQEVIVTGTMIKRVNAETTEAITILKADVLKDLGITNVEQALNQLTTNTPSINIASAVGSFSGGGTYANLRGLGNGRTLVLLDGQRLANNANTGNAVDLSGIPFSAIDSVQVLREGASALYGSDAIAGVINFITKKDYQGAEISANFDQPQQSGGQSGQAEFSLGTGDLKSDGYNFMATASYHRQQELRAYQRDFSAPGFDPAGGYFSTNNPGTWPGQVNPFGPNTYQADYPACTGNPYLTTYFGNCAYKYSVATDLLPESHEASAMLSFTKTLPANNQFQAQYFYTRSELTGWSGPMFYAFSMNPASPYLPTAGELTCSGGAANCSGPPDLSGASIAFTDPNSQRYAGNINTEQRLLLTFSGNNGGWDYTVNGNYSLNKNINQNDGGYPVEFAVDGYNGPVTAPGGLLSVMINPFGPQTAAGQAYINSTFLSGTYLQGTDRRISLGANASHELGDAFNSGTPATFALGSEVSQERFAAGTTDYNTLVQAATGLTDSAVEGSRQVIAAYMELDVPITKALDLDVSDRQDRYSDFGTTNNPKIALRYQPATFLTLRGTASTGFRAPTLFDLYNPNSLAASTGGTMGSGNPDCGPTGTGPGIAPFTTSTCNTQGLGLFGGNPNLTPEKSQNFDFGIVVQPIQDMGITIDYYRILLKNTIGTIPAETIYASPTVFANQYVLNSAGGLTPSIQEATACTPYTAATCGYIKQDFTNTGGVSTDGIDLSIEYAQHTSIGTFHEDLEGTAVTQYQLQQYTGGPELNLVGWYNQGNLPLYRWQQNLRVDWTSPEHMWGAGLNNRFYSTYIDEFTDGNGNPRTVGSYSVWESYMTVKPVENLTMSFGIKNLFDVSPPYTNAFQNNFASGYNAFNVDPTQRSFYINVKYKFF